MLPNIRLFVILGLTTSFLYAAPPRKMVGRVVDFNSPLDNPVGLDAVAIVARKPDGTIITTTQTDGDGGYELTGVQPGDHIQLSFSKPHYLNFPEEWEGVVGTSKLITPMMKQGEGFAYYSGIADQLALRLKSIFPQYDPAGMVLEEAWTNVRHFDLKLEERSAIKDRLGILIKGSELLNVIDAKLTGIRLKGARVDFAEQVARTEDLLPIIEFYSTSFDLTELSKDQLQKTAAFLTAAPRFSVSITGTPNWSYYGTRDLHARGFDWRADTVAGYLHSLGVEAYRVMPASSDDLSLICLSPAEKCPSKSNTLELHLVNNWSIVPDEKYELERRW